MNYAEEQLILSDPQIQAVQMQLANEGAPVDKFTEWALSQVKFETPGSEAAANVVLTCLLKKLKEWQESKKPKSLLGRIWKFVITGKWG